MFNVNFSKEVPVKYDVDIFIAGGGPAGMAAGVTAARNGSKVFLAESHSCFGGMGTAGLIPLFMQFSDGEHFLSAGFGTEIHQKIRDAGGYLTCGGKFLSIPAEKFKRIYDHMAKDSGLDFTFQTTLVDAIVNEGKVEYAICHSKSGFFAVKAKVFIDCTGDGDLAVRAGADYAKGDENGNLMPGTLCSLWANVDWDRVAPPEEQKMVPLLEEAFKENLFTVEDRHHSGMARTGNTLASANMGHTFGTDATDEVSITEAYLTGRDYLPEFEAFYRKYVKGYENVELAWSGSLIGIRETRRIKGDYELNFKDYLNRQQFDDQIGCYCFEIDIHPTTASKKDFKKSHELFMKNKYEKGEHYGIPYSCLRVKGLENMLVAGRCLSADRNVQSSIRTMPGCFITGQGAGMAASVATKDNTSIRDLNIKKLQENLRKVGAFL